MFLASLLVDVVILVFLFFSGIVAAHTKRTNDAQDVYSTTAEDLKNILPSLYSVRCVPMLFKISKTAKQIDLLLL